jgi:hypothetical protein
VAFGTRNQNHSAPTDPHVIIYSNNGRDLLLAAAGDAHIAQVAIGSLDDAGTIESWQLIGPSWLTFEPAHDMPLAGGRVYLLHWRDTGQYALFELAIERISGERRRKLVRDNPRIRISSSEVESAEPEERGKQRQRQRELQRKLREHRPSWRLSPARERVGDFPHRDERG